MALQFSDAGKEDLPNIVAIYNSTIASRMVTADTAPVSVESKLAWFHEHNRNTRPLLMVHDDTTLIGWMSLQDFYGRPAYNGTAEISIYIDEKHRGKGYGKKILQHAMATAANYQVHTLVGFIFAHNTPSLKLFASQGFEQWGNLKNIAVMDNIERSLTIMGKRLY
ncbi:GNAT family N-acetyltransferase [Parasediminibacterium paludis]|uniref:GNAT family N-acetyltransferase n=1 Tax=Parasediminibacterium paludis TaxID=908966 RepID=A0ABV8Q1H2_9BACT